MSLPLTRAECIEYCLRKLGKPVVQINVAEEQLNDRIDEAIRLAQEYSFDFIEERYVQHVITDEDVANGYISLPDDIFGITRIVPFQNVGGWGDSGIFDIQYQIHLSDFWNRSGVYGTQLVHFDMTRRHLALMDFMLRTETSFNFNRKTNRLYIEDQDLGDILYKYGGSIAIKCYVAVDVTQTPRVWQDPWLLRYATALIKQQWGQNLKKYSGVQLPGGVTLNGESIFSEATSELDELRKELRDNNELPVDFLVC